jgi:hypothetical protein
LRECLLENLNRIFNNPAGNGGTLGIAVGGSIRRPGSKLARGAGWKDEIEMPGFSQCCQCAELLTEQYGATVENKCMNCISIERTQRAAEAAAPFSDRSENKGAAPGERVGGERRRYARISTNVPARILAPSGCLNVTVLDVSIAGAKLLSERELPNGPLILVLSEQRILHVTMAWRDGLTAGVSFAEAHEEAIATMAKAAAGLKSLPLAA